MAILLKTTSVRVSSIQIMQVRVQNKGKSVWKSRYVGDVSAPLSYSYKEKGGRGGGEKESPPPPTLVQFGLG